MQQSLILIALIAAASAFSPPAALPFSPRYAPRPPPCPLSLQDKRGPGTAEHTWTLALATDRCISFMALNTPSRCSSGASTATLRRSYPLRVAPHGSSKRLLQLRMAVRGPNRKDEATSYFSKAKVFESGGRYHEALALYTKSLDILIQEYGPDHSTVATTYSNLASVYEALSKFEDALAMYKQYLRICIKEHGPDHPSVATPYNNMACVYNTQGKYEEALELFRKSLDIRIQAYGPEHSSVATAYGNIARMFMCQGKNKEALALLKKVGLLKKLEAMKRRS